MMPISKVKFSALLALVSVLLYPAFTLAESRAETLEISCQEKDGKIIAERFGSKALKKDKTFEQNLRCNEVLSNLLASGFELTSLSRKGKGIVYILEGPAIGLALGPKQPDQVPLIDCIRNDFETWTCKCDGWPSECTFLALMCGEYLGNDQWTCDSDHSSAAARVENVLSKLSAN